MNATTHLKIGDINKNLICILCRGYYIDATTIIECLHSFCRTCIVTYLKTNKTCPVCETVVHKTRPHQNIRSDKLLQDLVYKLVPGLYKDEMKRRREFYTRHYYAAPKRPGEERGDEMSDRFIFTEEEKISLALHLCRDGASERVDFRRVFASRDDLKARVEKRIKEAVDVRYLQCKAAVTVGHLKKFVLLKYGLPSHFQVDLFYNDELLRNSCTLCDIAYFFNWRRRAPLTLTFCVYECSSEEYPGKESSLQTNIACNKKSNTSTVALSAPISTLSSSAPVDSITNKTCVLSAHPAPTHHVSPAVTLPLSERLSDVGSRTQQLATREMCKQEDIKKTLPLNPSLEVPPLSASKTGQRRRRAKTGAGLLGKRSAANPIPIAPAPAKMPRGVFPYVVNIVDSKAQTGNDSSCDPRQIIGLVPVNTHQTVVSSAPSSRGLEIPTSSLSFSMSSILQIVTGANSVAASSSPQYSRQAVTSVANPFPSRPAAMTSGTTVSSMLSATPSCQTSKSKSKNAVTAKANLLEKKKPTRDLLSSSSLSSSCPTSSVSYSTSASSNVTITQSSHNNSVGSPTPAASASPTPAAVPIQQSQTQGSDMLTTHSNRAAEHQVSTTRPTPVQSQNSVRRYPTDIERPSGFYRETMDLHSPETAYTSKTSQGHEASRRLCNGPETTSDSITIKTEIPSSPIPSEESPTSFHRDNSVERHLNNSATSSTSSPPSDPTSVSCVMRKQNKHKKIADIANTLHKRVSDAMLNSSTNPGSNSPSNRRSTQSSHQGGKALNKLAVSSDSSRAPPSTPVSHRTPQNGAVFLNANSAHLNHNSQADEPLNLVKRDVNILRQMAPGMHAADLKQILKKPSNI